jgi:cob(I)alamin adenosyltransferase
MKTIIQIYTGDGKGKTTAALGLALRAAGSGMRVFFGQYFKSGKIISSEEKALKKINNVTFKKYDIESPLFSPDVPLEEIKNKTLKAFADSVRAFSSGRYGLVVLDELTYVANLKLVKESEVVKALKKKHKNTEVVITGRNASAGLIKAAGLVTEMKAIKHPFDKGLKARKGIEF